MKNMVDSWLEDAHQQLMNDPEERTLVRLKIKALEEEYHLKTIQDEINNRTIRTVYRKS